MGADFLWTFFSRLVQPLSQREMTMWMYLGPSCPDCPFSLELDDTEINTLIQGVHARGADMNVVSSLAFLRERVNSSLVSLFELTSVCLCQFLLLSAYALLCRVLGTCVAPHMGSPYLRVWRGGRPTVPKTNGCGNGDNDV
jgi:hypothetical protein